MMDFIVKIVIKPLAVYDFEESKQLLRDKNWITRRFQGEWLNFCCEQCLKEYRNKMQN